MEPVEVTIEKFNSIMRKNERTCLLVTEETREKIYEYLESLKDDPTFSKSARYFLQIISYNQKIYYNEEFDHLYFYGKDPNIKRSKGPYQIQKNHFYTIMREAIQIKEPVMKTNTYRRPVFNTRYYIEE